MKGGAQSPMLNRNVTSVTRDDDRPARGLSVSFHAETRFLVVMGRLVSVSAPRRLLDVHLKTIRVDGEGLHRIYS